MVEKRGTGVRLLFRPFLLATQEKGARARGKGVEEDMDVGVRRAGSFDAMLPQTRSLQPRRLHISCGAKLPVCAYARQTKVL